MDRSNGPRGIFGGILHNQGKIKFLKHKKNILNVKNVHNIRANAEPKKVTRKGNAKNIQSLTFPD